MSATEIRPVVRVESLAVTFGGAAATRAIRDVSIEVAEGEIVGLVGESGSGKSLTGLSLAGLLPSRLCRVSANRLELFGRDLRHLTGRELQELRGPGVALVFQEPMSALNPTLRIGALMIEVIRRHSDQSRREAEEFALQQLESVSLPDCRRVLKSFPFELSGGMRQRVLIALAFSMNPKLLVADEPTTALDVTVQADIIRLLRRKALESGAAVLFISHDLPLVAQLCSRIYVMRRGRVVEAGPTATILEAPATAYTQRLINSLPARNRPRHPIALPGAAEPVPLLLPSRTIDRRKPEPALELADLTVRFVTSTDWVGRPRTTIDAVSNVSLTVERGETFSVIGESGSGKTTLARAALGLIRPTAGTVRRHATLQMVFQDPKSTMNPRLPVWRIVTEPAAIQRKSTAAELRGLATGLLEQVGISARRMDHRPHQFSGGQRQRLALARALSSGPELLILDEPTSALDVAVQAQILNLLLRLQQELGLTYLLISHDVGVVRHMSDRVAVMRQGQVVESGAADDVLGHPAHPYTKALLAAVPPLAWRTGK